MAVKQSSRPVAHQQETGKTKNFLIENQKSLVFIGGAIVVLILLFFGYQKFILEPREQEARSQMFRAEEYFGKKEWDKAIKGDGAYPGFEKIVDEYSNTKSANLAQYYLGIAYLNTGKYEKAIEHLGSYTSNDPITDPLALGAIGDAYTELKNYDKAITFYGKAADQNDNSLTRVIFLKKLALVYEQTGNKEKAIETYKKIKSDYPDAPEVALIDAYIARLEAK